MANRRHAAALTIIGIAIAWAAAGEFFDRTGPTHAAMPALGPSTDDGTLHELLLRAQHLTRDLLGAGPKAGTDLGAELDALLAAAEAVPASPSVANVWTDLHEFLGYCVTLRGDRDGAQSARAARVAALHRMAREQQPDRIFPLRSSRGWAHACLEAGDLRQLAAAVQAGKSRPADDQLELALLHLLEARMHCLIGRLDTAGAALDAAASLLAEVQATPTAARQQEVQSASLQVAMVRADLCLSSGDANGAQAAISGLPASLERRVYEAVAAALSERDDAIQLLKRVRPELTGPRLRLVLGKLVQLQLLRGRDDDAAASLRQLVAATPTLSDDDEGRTTALRMELALRGKLPLDAALREDGRRALDQLLRRWLSVPTVRGGTGFLHLDDRATLVLNLMRVEAALATDRPATAALATLLQVHATAAGRGGAIDTNAVLAEFVAEDRGLLALIPGRFQSLALCFHRGDSTISALASSSVLRHRGQQLHQDAARWLRGKEPARADVAALAASARDLLPVDLATQLRRARYLTVSGAGMLDSLPFDLLPLGDEDVPCGLQHAIAYEENLVVGAARATARTHGEVAFLGSLRAPDAGGAKLAMPRAVVQHCLRSHRDPSVALDHEASPAAVLAAIRTARILHLVAHGTFRVERLDPNGMSFGVDPSEQLFAADIDGSDLRGLVVLLGACRVGDNPRRRGGDPLSPSLAGAMLAHGARCVLAATTEIELFRHCAAMAVVHEQLSRGVPMATALLHARATADSPVEQLELLLMQLHGRGD